MLQTVTVILYAIWAGESFNSEYVKTAFACSFLTAFSGLRIYAISNHNRLVTLVVVLLALVPVGTNIVRVSY